MTTINYCKLFVGRRFTVPHSDTVYVKIADSHAVAEETGEDAIFSLSEKCIPCGNNKALLNQILDKEAVLFGGSR